MTLFDATPFISAAGLHLPWKIECDALTDDDWDALVTIVAERLLSLPGRFTSVEGVPRGGIKLADKLRPILTKKDYGHSVERLLIVDDVMTTGWSMERQRNGRDAVGFVVFQRGRGLPWVHSFLTVGRLFR